ncbi:class I tRNA ligase family protein [Metamycoplasma hyosynoviae]|uniref:class I tRNA ligase family protein n=1 Tax=Metamycoplasma hyosynoviae TaxID=29559 RepID=UPI0023587616|nr:class I tRNA ligase family protein [Metamycoplasma hyosynoviae]MDC8917066.1 class I tRNA ligase family protein [Metamycoplasma hyosynoviae]
MKKCYYLCGPTVYNKCHIGNLRPILTFDLMIRSQKYLGENISFLHNITDIDDKIINKAIETNKTEKEISEEYTKYYFDQLKNFNVEFSNIKIVKVTDEIKDLCSYIQKIIDKGFAYSIGQNIFFDVMKLKDEYGKISGQDLSKLKYEEGEISKRHPADFALWKETSVGIKFDSPFGFGRPGWHTECSLFIDKYFDGNTIDIHGGGIDLIFPHHENENIQHFALHQKPIAKKWIHFGTLNYNNQKMSKSIGNIIYPDSYLEKYSADSYRLLLLTTNYAKPIMVTDELMQTNNAIILKFEKLWNKYQLEKNDTKLDLEKIKVVMQDASNLEFAKAYKNLLELSKRVETLPSFFEVMRILGFNFPNKKLSKKTIETYTKWKKLVAQKDYTKADELRKMLIEENII